MLNKIVRIELTGGLIGMVLLFSGMQSSLSMVYDREMGVMRLLLTAPLPRWYLLTAKLFSGTFLSVLQAYVFLIICLPIIKNNFQMDFYKYSFKEPLKINKLGIPEPINSLNRVIPDLIFVPLLGYDNNLNRLGYGGGFYDRYFEKNSKSKKIIKIGLAFSFQEIKELPINKLDKKIDRIITEKKI